MSSAVIFRDARVDDLPYIVSLLADDPLGAQREQLGDPVYRRALEEIDADPTTRFLVAEEDGVVIGCIQVSFLPGLARRGTRRAVFESVRIAGSQRSKGLGEQMVAEAIRLAREAGCGMAELSSDQSRKDAHRFWERQGFRGSHLGMKLML